MEWEPWQAGVRRRVRRFRWQLRSLAGRDLMRRVELRCPLDSCPGTTGGWVIHPAGLGPGSVVYSCGIGRDISWDRYLMQRYRLPVHAFDPTPAVWDWLAAADLPDGFQLHRVGVADFDGEAWFHPPVKRRHIDYTIVDRKATRQQAIRVRMQRLSTIMAGLGHTRIDVLKMDIEGAEYGVIDEILSLGIEVGQLLVEFHHRFPEIPVSATRQALRRLHAAGYRIFAVADSGQEYGFLGPAAAAGEIPPPRRAGAAVTR